MILCILALSGSVVFAAPSAPQAEWGFLVYMNADNDLDPFSVKDLAEIEAVKAKPWLTTIVLVDHATETAALLSIKDGNRSLIREVPEPDMGDVKTLVSFVREAVETAPAKHYALVIWNHGRGWKGPAEEVQGRGISFDDQSGHHITTNQLADGLAEIRKELGRKIDILAFDACNMQMAEVACAVHQGCNFIVGSEEIVPMGGQPYERILGSLVKGATPAQFAGSWVQAFNSFYSAPDQKDAPRTTLSAIDAAGIPDLLDGVTGLAKAMMSGSWNEEIKDALFQVQKFHIRENIDLGHFASILKSRIKEEGIQTACQKLEEILARVIPASGNTGGHMLNARGIAIYFPVSAYSFSKQYSQLQFAKSTLWDEMLFDFYKKITGPSVAADLKANTVRSLAELVRNQDRLLPELKKDALDRARFLIRHDQGISPEVRKEASDLLDTLKDTAGD